MQFYQLLAIISKKCYYIKVDYKTVKKWEGILDLTGDVLDQKPVRKTKKFHNQEVRKYVEENPSSTLKEIAEHFGCCVNAASKAMKRLEITRKKVKVYKEASPEKRREYLKKVSEIPKKDRVYVDESGLDKYYFREYGWFARGKKIIEKISGRKFDRLNIVAGYCENKPISPFYYRGNMNGGKFENWFENHLLKVVKKVKQLLWTIFPFIAKNSYKNLHIKPKLSFYSFLHIPLA